MGEKTLLVETDAPGTELLAHAGLESPFDDACLRGVCEKAEKYLASYDLTGIE